MLKLTTRGKKGIFWITGSLNGDRYRESTGTSSREHAQQKLAVRQKDILDRDTFGAERTTTFAEAVIHYVHTGGEKRFLPKLVERWGERRIADITPADVAASAHELYPGRTAAWHVRAVYTPVNAVIRRAHRAGMCALIVFEKPKIKHKTVRYAADDWFHKILPHCNVRLAGILMFMTLTGARVQEACNLMWSDTSLERGEALLRETKGGVPRVVKLHVAVIDALTILQNVRGGEETVFGLKDRWSVNNAIKRAAKRAQVDYLSSHKVGRHAFAARLLREGHSIRVVQDAGGWKVMRMVSDHYGHLERSHVEAAVLGSGAGLTQIGHNPPNTAKHAPLKKIAKG